MLGLAGLFRSRLDEDVFVAAIAVCPRLLVFRIGSVLLLFVMLDAALHSLPRARTNPYCDEGMEIIVGIYVLLPAVVSIVLAAVAMFDARFQQPRAAATSVPAG